MRIFIIHNNINEIRPLKAILENAQHAVDYEMEKALIQEYLISEVSDLIIINSNLNNIDAIEIISQYRLKKHKTPILFLCEAQHEITQGITALEKGADDFIVSPINIREFLARINVLYRRSSGQYHRTFKYGPLEVDSLFKRYRLDGKRIELSLPEGKVLETLIKQPEHTITKEKIASSLFSAEDQISCNRVQPHICRLRKKIQHPDIEIKTIHRFGYCLVLK